MYVYVYETLSLGYLIDTFLFLIDLYIFIYNICGF